MKSILITLGIMCFVGLLGWSAWEHFVITAILSGIVAITISLYGVVKEINGKK